MCLAIGALKCCVEDCLFVGANTKDAHDSVRDDVHRNSDFQIQFISIKLVIRQTNYFVVMR